VQIHLQQNRLDLAKKEAVNARKWAQDSLLVNIIESWVGMREVKLVQLSGEMHKLTLRSRAANTTKQPTTSSKN
jgi:hypothetical protein